MKKHCHSTQTNLHDMHTLSFVSYSPAKRKLPKIRVGQDPAFVFLAEGRQPIKESEDHSINETHESYRENVPRKKSKLV